MIFGKAIGSAGAMQAFVLKNNEETKAAIPMKMSLARTASELIESPTIYGNAIGCVGMAQTYVFEDEDGNEVFGVITNSETELTATENDIRLGKLAVTSIGLTNGYKEIPAYHTTEGHQAVMPNNEIKITNLKNYEYTKLQVLICAFNSSIANSVATEKVCINNNVYAVGSTESIATVTIDAANKELHFGITNDGDSPLIIRYFTYKEVY